MAIKLVIDGRPIPAVRMTQRGKYVNKFAQRYINYKALIGFYARRHFKEVDTEDFYSIDVKSYLYGKCSLMGMDGDIDNYLKSAMDGIQKIVYKDDRQVLKGISEKIPAKTPKDERMEIVIEKIKIS